MEDQLKNIPTIVLSELPQPEREKYFKFLLENDVQFIEDGRGYYTAIIKVLNSKDQLALPRLEKSRILNSTFSYKQKMVITESPRSITPTSANRSFAKSIDKSKSKSKSPIRRGRSPNDYSAQKIKGISELLDQDPLHGTKSNQTLNISRSSARTPEKQRPDPLKLFLQTTKFQEFFNLLKLQGSSHLRPKTLSITMLMKTIEEVYSARYKKETAGESRKTEENAGFAEFLAEFMWEKYKNKRMVDQSALDLCQSAETYENENLEIRLFSQFLTGAFSTEILVFFLYARQAAQTVLNLQLVPKFPAQKISETRLISLSYKQCAKVAGTVYAEEEWLLKSFMSELDGVFKGPSIKLYDFLAVFIENYKGTLQENHSLSPFTDDKSNEQFTDSITAVEVEENRYQRPVSFGAVPLETRPPASNSIKFTKDPIQDSRPLPKSPFDRIKELCVEHCENKLVKLFVRIILSGYLEDLSDDKDDIISQVEEIVMDKMNSLIEAVCRCDKRKWMEVLETDNKDCLKYCENLQKRLREIQKKDKEPNSDDIDQICKEILQTPELKLYISEQIRSICA
ncbi:hypothetical protein SteCoe_2636 [Stentor coeruleus]|uniref:Uncharacterized protein n=1 Tax=Stentor coeruleus TaxID=5963 RepID=A0A1R2CZ76_9CILI|nr:hypothetical protein SteCoe_2636 [Stentor coeruleus]